MILKSSTFEELADTLQKSSKKIIVFGAGMIGTVTTPYILGKYMNVEEKIRCYIDNDSDKQGTRITQYKKMVYSIEYLKNIDINKNILIITISRYSDVLKQLSTFNNLDGIVCYIMPMLCIANFTPGQLDGTVKESDSPKIPKTIHYMWLGKKKIPDSLQICIDSWKKYCPDYEIKCWNEDNYDISKNRYMEQAYKSKNYGFVPDYARVDILYHYGGIYLDTDVELKKSLDNMLYQEAFCCVEKWQTINLGGGSGAVKGNPALGELLRARQNLAFIDANGKPDKNTCGYYDTLTMIKNGYVLNNTIQNILGMNIYTYEYFHPYDYMSGRTQFTSHTYGIHHFNGGWLTPELKEANIRTAEEFEKIYATSRMNENTK